MRISFFTLYYIILEEVDSRMVDCSDTESRQTVASPLSMLKHTAANTCSIYKYISAYKDFHLKINVKE